MSSRPQFSPYAVIKDGDMSDDITSDVTIIQKLSLIAYAITWDGTSPLGTIIVEVSNDYTQDAQGIVKNPGTWNALQLSNPTPVSGNTGEGFIDIYATAGYALRFRYVRGSGSGVMQAIVSGKVA